MRAHACAKNDAHAAHATHIVWNSRLWNDAQQTQVLARTIIADVSFYRRGLCARAAAASAVAAARAAADAAQQARRRAHLDKEKTRGPR